MSLPVHVRCETAGDAEAIVDVVREAFLHHPYSSHTEQYIVQALRRNGALTLSLVAEAEGSVVGHIAFSPVEMSDDSTGWFGLGPVAVLPAFQGCGIGSDLVRTGLAMLRDDGAAGCVLLGEPEFYERFGFIAHPALRLDLVDPAHFLSVAFSGARPRAEVRYHDSFDATA